MKKIIAILEMETRYKVKKIRILREKRVDYDGGSRMVEVEVYNYENPINIKYDLITGNYTREISWNEQDYAGVWSKGMKFDLKAEGVEVIEIKKVYPVQIQKEILQEKIDECLEKIEDNQELYKNYLQDMGELLKKEKESE